MLRMLLAAAAAFALFTAAPAVACPDCKNCEHHKVAAADEKAPKKDAPGGKVTCACAESKDCKCAAKCECPVCHPKKGEKKEEAPKKS